MPDEDDLVAEMVSTLGPLPQQWWKSWRKRNEFFLDDGSWRRGIKRTHDAKSRHLSQRFREMGREQDSELTLVEITAVKNLLKAMLTYLPLERISIGEVVRSEWMKR